MRALVRGILFILLIYINNMFVLQGGHRASWRVMAGMAGLSEELIQGLFLSDYWNIYP